MTYFVILLTISLVASELINVWVLKRVVKRFEKIEKQIEAYDRRIDQMEMAIVRNVLEDNPQIGERVIAQQKALYQGGLRPEVALEEARRLNGLDPLDP